MRARSCVRNSGAFPCPRTRADDAPVRTGSMTHGPELAAAVATAMGEPGVAHDYTFLRAVAPGDGRQTDLHYDHVFFGCAPPVTCPSFAGRKNQSVRPQDPAAAPRDSADLLDPDDRDSARRRRAVRGREQPHI